MIYQDKAIMIRQTNYSESSRIITILTENGISVPLMARGFNKINSPFTSLKQGFQNILFTYSRYRGMGTLTEVDVIHPYRNMNADFDLYTGASYVLEVISRVVEEDYPDKNLYDLCKIAFDRLDDGSEMYAVLSFVLIKLFPKYGVGLNIERCMSCGSYDFKKLNRYSFKFHGLLCTDCQTEESIGRSVFIEPRIVYLIAFLKHVRINDLNSIDINTETAKKMFRFVEMLFLEYSGEYFKARKMLDI
ncbi:DNA repair protein RecO [Phocicoccus pinnipedialis]|uniref:DNA repair protein RecO n=1 Tax=Phocicoccus pinnipedialis TaxID=110845 RepID=A0A6V7REI9_9BACL|nr:DNA repair protein RecO [Jeotgalicoccus pinnipedialis]MBP1939273.1 DNA repair protein RecO (recombination protein O) [Jeotgalicoccus pinnipedialis]CAD2076072.1 DNA repair protein RecO [Jeotgalicoccus pinnipedialis]